MNPISPRSYLVSEEKQIIDFIIGGNFQSSVNGRSVWRAMVEANICENRSWESLRNHYLRHMIPNLSRPEFGLTKEQRDSLKKFSSNEDADTNVMKRKALNTVDTTSAEDDEESVCSSTTPNPDSRLKKGSPYTTKEDLNILEYLLTLKGDVALNGNKVWQIMVKKQICPGRTFQSLREHFKKKIAPNLSRPQYMLEEQDIERLRLSSRSDKYHKTSEENILERFEDVNYEFSDESETE